jgi:hypothetical protein
MFPRRGIHKYTWTSPGGKKTHKQIDHILIDRRRHSSVIGVPTRRRMFEIFKSGEKLQIAVVKGFGWLDTLIINN